MKEISFTLRPLAPFRLDLTAWTLRRRGRNIVDSWDGRTYRRVISVSGSAPRCGILIHVLQSGTIDRPLLHVMAEATSITESTRATVTLTLERLLGLSVDMEPFYRFATHYPKLDALAQRFRRNNPENYRLHEAPYGFSKRRNQLIPNRAEMRICRLVVSLRGREGMSTRRVAMELMKSGIKNRRGKVFWTHTGVGRIFKRWNGKV